MRPLNFDAIEEKAEGAFRRLPAGNYVCRVTAAEDFEQKFTASQTYDSTLQLTSVQDGLLEDMTKDIVDQIFNATVANW